MDTGSRFAQSTIVGWGRLGVYMLLAGRRCGGIGITPVWSGVVEAEVDTG